MPSIFEVYTDNVGRINHFVPRTFPDTAIKPEAMRNYADGDEIILVGETEYALLENGSLVHPEVYVPDEVTLGNGVRLDKGVSFDQTRQLDTVRGMGVTVGDSTRLKGTNILPWVTIGKHALILAKSIGADTTIGDHTRMGKGVSIGSSTTIGDSVKIDVEASISEGVQIGDVVRIGFKTRICEGALIGERARIGRFTGEGPRINQNGPYIRPGRVVLPREVILD